jgi:GNAT superfamily N-acetyltransferase
MATALSVRNRRTRDQRLETRVRYYTLSSTAVNLVELPGSLTRRLPRYPLVPATRLGRLAVDLRCRGRGYGRHLLPDALCRVARSEIASFA